MNIYSVSTGCYSDYSEWFLTHEEIFEKEKFVSMCKEACDELIKKDDYLSYGTDVAKWLIEKKGFKRFNYIHCHVFDYSYKPDGDGDELPKIFEHDNWEL